MRKMMIAAFAALMMCVSFSSCGSSSQEDRLLAGLEEILDFYKNTQITSANDVIKFLKNESELDEKMDEKYGVIDENTLDFTEEQQKRYDELMEAIEQEKDRVNDAAIMFIDQINSDDLDLGDIIDEEDIEDIIDDADLDDAIESALDDLL